MQMQLTRVFAALVFTTFSMAFFCGGCARQAAVKPAAVSTPAPTAESQQNFSKFLENDPNMPPQQKAALKAQMQKSAGTPRK